MTADLSALLGQWEAARMRTFLARRGVEGTAQASDYWAELELATTIARDVTAGRWCAVADLVRLGAVESWAQVGDALGLTETEAADGFRQWIGSQAELNGQTGGRIGLAAADAAALYQLADAVRW